MIKDNPMSQSKPIDCWLSLGSTYSYLTVMRMPELSAKSGVEIRLRPFYVGRLFREMGYFPFPPDAPKTKYMWQDLQRRSAYYGIDINMPVSYPARQADMANKIAIIGLEEGWGEAFVRTAYRNWFVEGKETGSEPNISDSLREVGQDPDRVIPIASGPDLEAALTKEIATAKALGIFGAPTFVVGDQLFWGDDRLEDAIKWAQHGTLART
jgi:2-hydroxychromene-2-carboxylate isomerase